MIYVVDIYVVIIFLTWKYWLADAFSVLSSNSDRFFILPEAAFNSSLKSLTSAKER